MASSGPRKTFEQGTAAFNAHDIDGFAATMTEDVSARAPGVGLLTGRQAVTGFYKSWLDAFPDGGVEIQAVHFVDDGFAVEEGAFHGTHRAPLRGPGGDLPATGRSVRVAYMQVLQFRGDKVSSFHLMFDRLELLEQLGVAAAASGQPSSDWRREAEPQHAQPH
jgi:predicted ester cyclase